MNYTIQVNEVNHTEGNIRAFASLVFSECFKITNIAILENKEKGELFVSMPRYKSSQRNEDNEPVYKDVCNPITKEFREELYVSILQAYENVKNKTGENVIRVIDGKKVEAGVAEEKEATELKFSVSVANLQRESSDIKGLARIFIEDCFVINNVSIIQGKENLFVAMPSYKTKKVDENNQAIYQDVCYPITKEFREKLYGIILGTYEKERQEIVQEERRDNEAIVERSEQKYRRESESSIK